MLPPHGIGGKAVVSASLDVQGHEVQAAGAELRRCCRVGCYRLLEEVVAELDAVR